MKPWELHPALVHFPVALLLSGVLLDGYALWRKREGLVRGAFLLQLWGVGAGWVASLAGLLAWSAAPRVYELNPLMVTHPLLACGSLVAFTLLVGLRWRSSATMASAVKQACGAGAALLVLLTAYTGGHLVYRGATGITGRSDTPQERGLSISSLLGISGTSDPNPIPANAQYVGSAQCKSCHSSIYERWSRTLMANVVRDPKVHPEAITPDLKTPNPLVTFRAEDIAFVYGSKWKQRYFTKIGEDYYPFPAQWDVTHKVWRPYKVAMGTDWWTAHYPDDNMKRPTGPLCDGCHSVNYDIKTKTVTEWNVGCERCHGAGSEHVKETKGNIVNPARIDAKRANDTCIQCHSQGRPPKGAIHGTYYDWPVGFHMGLKLEDFWELEDHKLGTTSFTHFADGTAHKNRMQGNDFVTSQMCLKGITCFDCHDVHGTQYNADVRRPGNKLCLGCHSPESAIGPRQATLELHTHHKGGSPGSECANCHMPRIEQTISDVMVRSHTFRFIPPTLTESVKTPNSCNSCHSDKSTEWALTTLKSWPEFSVWRVAR
jgi:predicted CXXCH cytochrome family protein